MLRNSDHVTPEAKTALLDEVLSSWIRVCHTLVILSPVLAVQRKATFEEERRQDQLSLDLHITHFIRSTLPAGPS